MQLRRHLLLPLALLLSPARADELEQRFATPPPEARTRVLWMWMGSNITREGITRDLEALRDAGFGGASMFSLADVTAPWGGPIRKGPTPEIIAFTDPWWLLVKHAALEAKRLGLDFGIHNCPGYESSGGNWITPEMSMQELIWSEHRVTGPLKFAEVLPQATVNPEAIQMWPDIDPLTGNAVKAVVEARRTFYRDIAALALPASGVVAREQVIDVSGRMDATGNLQWDVPAGDWIIYRFGHTTMGTRIQPAQHQAAGLECDKMNPVAVETHLNHVLEEMREHLGDLVGTAVSHLHFDSYEAGFPTWTPRMTGEFAARRGYPLTPWLATFAKRVVVSEAETARVRADFQRTVKDLYRDAYYGTAKRLTRAAGLQLSSEPYGGPWEIGEIVPQLDRPVAEFWTHKGEYRPLQEELHALVASVRILRPQPVIDAEAFTGDPSDSRWSETPAWLKRIGDQGFVQGINRMVLHHFAHQPWDPALKPGMTMGQWGTHFSQNQTWWEPGKAWVAYLNRCQALLQWGNPNSNLGFQSDNEALKATRRSMEGAELFFIANSSRNEVAVKATFAVAGSQPELWDPVRATRRDLPEFEVIDGKTVVPLTFAASESAFIVFRKSVTTKATQENFPKPATLLQLGGAWQVAFDPRWGGPAAPVTFSALTDWTTLTEPGVKYFSGTATYTQRFDVPPGLIAGVRELDLGKVNHLAKVTLNGRDLGVVWTAPWSVAVPTGLLKAADNELSIAVTNVWANRLIGDEQEPPDMLWSPGFFPGNGGYLKEFPDWFLKNERRPSKNRLTFTTWNYFTKDSPLVPSGLLGPVTLGR
ncbi:MAG: glycosyl hydrolase [Verrucomicrobiota bacterium]